MSTKTTTLTVPVDTGLLEEFEWFCEEKGLDTTTTIIFMLSDMMEIHRYLYREPNEETLAALEESKSLSRDPSVKRYAHFSELLAEIEEEMRNEV